MSGATASLLAAGAAALAAMALVHGLRSVRVNGLLSASAIGDADALGARAGRLLGRAGLSAAATGRIAAAAGVAAVTVALLLDRPWVAPVAGLGVLAGAVLHRMGASRRRSAAIVRQLPGVAASVATGLRAGLSLRQALTRVARDAPEPSAAELARVARDLDLGARVESSLGGLAQRVRSRELRLMIAAIEVQRHAGGNLAAALDDLSIRLGERARLARELRGLTAQARLTAWMVGALPLAAGALVEIVAPGTLGRSLLAGPGLVAAVVACGLYGGGAALVYRIGRVAT